MVLDCFGTGMLLQIWMFHARVRHVCRQIHLPTSREALKHFP